MLKLFLFFKRQQEPIATYDINKTNDQHQREHQLQIFKLVMGRLTLMEIFPIQETSIYRVVMRSQLMQI